MAIVPKVEVDPPAQAPLEYGLFSVLGFRTSGDRWETGTKWLSNSTSKARGIGEYPDDETPQVGMPKEVSDALESGEASPFTIYKDLLCSPIGSTYEELRARVEAELELKAQARVEQALWTGDLGNVPNLSGANGFPSPTSLDVGGASLVEVLAELEEWIGKTLGHRGVLHMSRYDAILFMKEAGIEARNGQLRTPLGTPVVAGAGYPPGSVVATGALAGYQSEIFSPSASLSDALDKKSNDLLQIAEKTFLVMIDPEEMASAEIGAE